MAKKKRLNQFRYSKKAKNHPAYIFEETSQKYKFMNLTHAPKTSGRKNIRLIKNPNPNDNAPSYIRPIVDIDDKSNFGKKKIGWKLHRVDKDRISKYKKEKKAGACRK